MTIKRMRFRAYPTSEQMPAIAQTFGCVRVAYNDALARQIEHYRTTGTPLSAGETSRLLTESKHTPERVWMNDVSSVPLQQALRHLFSANRAFFDGLSGRRKGRIAPPRFKRKSHRQSAEFTKSARFTVRQTTYGIGYVTLPKIGRIRFVLSRAILGTISSVTLLREPDGRHYVSFVVTEPGPMLGPSPKPDDRPVAGVDLGLTHLAAITCSNGERFTINNPRWLRAAERKLARLQRAYARTRKGSNNRDKARLKVAAAHRRVREIRADHHRKLALELVRNNHTVALETLNLRGLHRTRMARSMSDAGLGQLVRFITEAAPRYRTNVVRISQWEPTTQTCSVCRTPGGRKALSVRAWTCSTCGTRLDRDFNAAVNIMVAAGLAETENACGFGQRDLVPRLRDRKTLASVSAVPSDAGILNRPRAIA